MNDQAASVSHRLWVTWPARSYGMTAEMNTKAFARCFSKTAHRPRLARGTSNGFRTASRRLGTTCSDPPVVYLLSSIGEFRAARAKFPGCRNTEVPLGNRVELTYSRYDRVPR